MNMVSKQQFSNGIKWKAFNLAFSKGLTFLSSIYIARMIEPEHYGYMAIWSVILAFCDAIVVGGLDTVLIQKSDLNNDDWNTGVTFAFCKGILISSVLILSSPHISSYYKIPELELLIRLSCIDVMSQPFIAVGVARCSKNIDYKKIFIADFSATVLGSAVSVFCIYIGKNVLVLILNNMVHQAVYGIMLLMILKIKMKVQFKQSSLHMIIRDGSKAMGNGILDLATSSVSNLYIGKKWTSVEVGYNHRAQSLVQILGVESYNVISNVLLPTFSSYQKEKEKLKDITRIMVSFSTYVMFPLMFGTAICAKELILFLFTEKWIQAVPYLQIGCVYYAFNPLRQLCMNLNYSYGGYTANNRIETLRFILTSFSIIAYQIIGLKSLHLLVTIGSLIAVLTAVLYLNSISNTIQYSGAEIAADIVPNLILTLIVLTISYIVGGVIESVILTLLVKVITAVIMYITLSYLSHNKTYAYLISSVKECFHINGKN